MRNTPIFVINLEKSVERREFIQTQFLQFPDIEYQFFTAVNGKENPDYPLFRKYNEKERFKRKGNLMSLSQLGCWASHYHLWETCVELGKPIIVLEDDAKLSSDFQLIYHFISSSQNTFNFFWLSPPAPKNKPQKGKPICSIANTEYQIQRFYHKWDNATGYFITPKAAKALLKFSEEWIYNVDITMDRYWEHKIDYLAIVPACVRPDSSQGSYIEFNKDKERRNLLTKLIREFYQLKDIINKATYRIREAK